jgi:collagenase-like PrtC family protease
VRASNYLELVCPAGTPAALRAAVDAGADTVYCGFRDCTNARNYPGLNFDLKEMREHAARVRLEAEASADAAAGSPPAQPPSRG